MAVFAATLVVGALGAARAAPSRHLLDMGTDSESYLLDADSLRREGDFVRYRLVWHDRWAGGDHEAQFMLDCRSRTRGTVEASEDDGGPMAALASQVPMRDVLPGTRQQRELAFVCAQHPAHTTTTERVAARTVAHGFTTGVLVSADGLVLAPKAPLRDCTRIEATIAGRVMNATPLGEDRFVDLAVLRVPGRNWWPSALRNARAEVGEPVTLVGAAGDGLDAAAGRLAATVGRTANDPVTIDVRMSTSVDSGPVIGAGGDVLGFATGPSGAVSGEGLRTLHVLTVAAMKEALWRFSPSGYAESAAPLDLHATLRRAIETTARLACFVAPSPRPNP